MNNILTISEYRNNYLMELTKCKLLDYFDRCITKKKGKQYKMVLLPKERHVYGGAWPGNATLSDITDYRKVKVYKSLKVETLGGLYYDHSVQTEEPYLLHTMAENIESLKHQCRFYLSKFPDRIKKLIIKENPYYICEVLSYKLDDTNIDKYLAMMTEE